MKRSIKTAIAIMASGIGALGAVQAQAATLFANKASFLSAAPTSSLIEDFESVSGGMLDAILPSLSRPTATYTPYAGVPFFNVYVHLPGAADFAPGNPAQSKVLVANGDEDFAGVLVTSAGALGFDVYLNDLGPLTVNFYNGASLLGSIAFLADANSTNNFQFAGITSAIPITSFRFTSTAGGTFNTGIDNLLAAAPSTGAVPEPATWALLLVGFGLIGASMRRRAKVVVSFS
jgi:PEP-CTERM motif